MHWAQDVHHRCDGEEVRCFDGLSQMPERNGHAHTCAPSAHAQQHGVADLRRASRRPVDMTVDRRGPEAGGEKRGHDDRGRDAVMGAACDLHMN